jgi:hypothetical protein
MFIAPKTYPSRKDWIIKLIIVGFVLLDLFGTIYLYNEMKGRWSEILPFTLAITLTDTLIIVIYFTTNYTFLDDELLCKSFIFRKRIEYQKITRIEVNRKFFVGLKLSLAIKGMVISYDSGSELFITPENEEEFISDLQFKNSSILIG